MIGSMKKKFVTAGLAVVAAGGSLFMGGCKNPFTVDPQDLYVRDASSAYEHLNERQNLLSNLGSVFGGDDATSRLVASAAKESEESISELRDAASRANIPDAALRAMVDDVSAYMLESLPADAKSRGIDGSRLTIVMNPFNNERQDPALDRLMTLIRANLARNNEFRRSFRLAAVDLDDRDEIMSAVSGGDWKILTDPNGEGDAVVPPDFVYVIQGRTFYDNEPGKPYELGVVTMIDAIHVGSQDTVSAQEESFQRTYFYHPARELSTSGKIAYPGYITEEENNRRMKAFLDSQNADSE